MRSNCPRRPRLAGEKDQGDSDDAGSHRQAAECHEQDWVDGENMTVADVDVAGEGDGAHDDGRDGRWQEIVWSVADGKDTPPHEGPDREAECEEQCAQHPEWRFRNEQRRKKLPPAVQTVFAGEKSGSFNGAGKYVGKAIKPGFR